MTIVVLWALAHSILGGSGACSPKKFGILDTSRVFLRPSDSSFVSVTQKRI